MEFVFLFLILLLFVLLAFLPKLRRGYAKAKTKQAMREHVWMESVRQDAARELMAEYQKKGRI